MDRPQDLENCEAYLRGASYLYDRMEAMPPPDFESQCWRHEWHAWRWCHIRETIVKRARVLKTVKIPVEIYADDGGYRAQIAGGCWVAWGKTRDEAVKKVVRWYKGEQSHLEGV